MTIIRSIAILAQFRATLVRRWGVFASCLLLAACAGPSVVRSLPPEAGTDFYIHAPAKQVFDRLPEAVRLSGLDWKGMDKAGPPDWQATALVGASLGTDGSWMRIVVEDLAPDLSHVSAVSRPRGGGIFASYDTPPRNVLLNTILVNSPAVQADSIRPIKRPDLRLNVVHFQELAKAAMVPLSKAEWSNDHLGMNAAFLAPIENRGLLIAYTGMRSVGRNPHARATRVTAIALYEFGTGREIWKRDVDLSGSLSLISVKHGLILQTPDQLIALDGSTGRDIWTFQHHGAASALDGEATYAVIWNREKTDTKITKGKKNADDQKKGKDYRESLQAVSLADGKVKWSVHLKDGSDAEPREIFIEGRHIYAIGRTITVYDIETGRPIAQNLTGFKPPIKHIVVKNQMVLSDASGVLACLHANGTIAWTKELRDTTDVLASDDGHLLVATSTGPRMTLRLFSLKSGEQRWEHHDNLLAGNPVFASRSVAYSTREKVVFLDRTSGREIGAAQRSEAMRRAALPDRLIAYDDRITVAGETGIMALSLGGKKRCGELLWRIDIRGADQSFYAARQDQARRALYNYGLAPNDWSFYGAGAYAQNLGKMDADSKLTQRLYSVFVSLANYQASLNRKERENLTHSEGTRYSSLSAGDRLRMLQANIAAERSQAFMNASAAMAFGAIGMAEAYVGQLVRNSAELVKAQAMRSQESIRRALELWAQSLQGEYFVRPIGWEFGSGILLLNLHTGRWKEIISGPGEPAVHDFYIQYFPATLDTDARHIFTMTQNGTQQIAEIPGYIIRSRTTAAFALNDKAGWHAPQEYPWRSLAPRPVLE